MKRVDFSSGLVFFLGILSCLFILSIFYFGRTIYAAGAGETEDYGSPSINKSAYTEHIEPIKIPKEWGELKAVFPVDRGGSGHMFYFEDKQGSIRYAWFVSHSSDGVVVYKRN